MPEVTTYERFYGPDKAKLLFRNDILQSPPPFGEGVAKLLQELDDWRFVPSGVETAADRFLARARQTAASYTSTATSLKTEEEARQKAQLFGEWHNELNSFIQNLKAYRWLALIYQHENAIQSAKTLAGTMLEINAYMSGIKADIASSKTELTAQVDKHAKELDELITKSTKTLDDTAKNSQERFEAILKKAAERENEIEAIFKQSQAHFQNQAMTAFGAAFNQESVKAETRANWMGVIGALATIAALCLATYLTFHTQDNATASADAAQLWRVLPCRVAMFAFLAWIIGHCFNERKSFLHVAVANRHRNNLCSAYIAGTKELDEKERHKYFLHIMPQISVLGKTGFITKETVPDMPGTPILKAAMETTRKATEK